MARRRRRDDQRAQLTRSATALRSLAVRLPAVTALPPRLHFDLTPIEDRRQYHPLNVFRPARTVYGSPVGPLKVARPGRETKARFRLPVGIRFDVPAKVAVCVRRKRRKEVLHALKKVGKGSGGGKRRRNFWSGVQC